MLSRLPKTGDMIIARKQWYWSLLPDLSVTDMQLTFGHFYTSQYKTTNNKKFIVNWKAAGPSHYMPRNIPLLVLSVENLTMKFLYDDSVYHVTAEKSEHILNDFDLISEIE